MAAYRDLTGEKFGRWTVLKFVTKKAGYQEFVWRCRCECGAVANVNGSTLKGGRSKSCGCYSVDRVRTHGMEGTPTYNVWGHMLSRCRNERHKQYDRYGGRGIKVCKRWHKFENFFADMGEKPPGLSLDRVDNDGDYKKSNCRWATPRQQLGNQERSLRFEWNGKMQTLSDLAREHGISRRKVYQRILKGWTLKDALTIKRANAWTRGARQ